MLRYKRWTFEAWYQSECTNIPFLAPWLAQYHMETILGKESYLVISFHHSILQLTYITQAWMFKFNTCAMQANIWNAHSNASSKFMSLLPLLVCSKFDPFPLSHLFLDVIYQDIFMFLSFYDIFPLFHYFCYYLCFSPPLSSMTTKVQNIDSITCRVEIINVNQWGEDQGSKFGSN